MGGRTKDNNHDGCDCGSTWRAPSARGRKKRWHGADLGILIVGWKRAGILAIPQIGSNMTAGDWRGGAKSSMMMDTGTTIGGAWL
jgi:hypothetical protein